MIVHLDVVQGTDQWLKLRMGIPTASAFDKILTPTGKRSSSAERYMHHLLAERMLGHPIVEHVTTWMDRGSASEAEAVSFYELERDLDTVKVGFVTNDEKTIGASPDRFVGEDGILEIKVPKESTVVSYLLKKPVDAEYYPQIQGQLWVTERKWLDVLAYHPELPNVIRRVERDEEYIKKLAEAVTAFSRELEEHAAECARHGWIRKPLIAPTAHDLRNVEFSIDLGEDEPPGLF